MDIEKKMQEMDFSRFSKVEGSLLMRLRMQQMAMRESEELSLDELDEVVAAGGHRQRPEDKLTQK